MGSEERALLQIELGNGMSINSIARRLNRSASTLSREIRRQGEPGYAATSATSAASNYRLRRRACVRRRRLVEG
ncbi:IS30 family transposase, partial [Xanthomonas oryzae pv. oryzicola]